MCDQSDITRYFSLQSTLAFPIARYHGSSKIPSKTNGHLTEPIPLLRTFFAITVLQSWSYSRYDGRREASFNIQT